MSRGGVALREIRVLFGMGSFGGLTDGQLLERFATRRDDAGELAFAVLVDRHGPMVLRVCLGLLRDQDDAEDAFQATFLVLARKAGSLWVRESLGPWLHGVARRVSIRSRSDGARRKWHERRAAGQAPSGASLEGQDDLDPVLHEEVDRLPERFRVPIVLCYLQGLTHDQAARQLGWPVGTVRSRLARGRERLRDQLDRRGVAPSVGLLNPGPVSRAPGMIRAALAEATVRAATRVASGTAAAAGAGPAVVALTRGVLRTMILNRVLKIAAGVMATGVVATGAAAFAFQGPEPGQAVTKTSRGANPPGAARPDDPPKSEAEKIAEQTLNVGSRLFDAKDAAALAATYTEDGEIHLIGKQEGQIRDEVKRGRPDVEQFYRDYFRDTGTIDSENTVEFARLIAPDLLVIHGRFRPDIDKTELPFVQMRMKRGNEWLMSKLWLFLAPEGQ